MKKIFIIVEIILNAAIDLMVGYEIVMSNIWHTDVLAGIFLAFMCVLVCAGMNAISFMIIND